MHKAAVKVQDKWRKYNKLQHAAAATLQKAWATYKISDLYLFFKHIEEEQPTVKEQTMSKVQDKVSCNMLTTSSKTTRSKSTRLCYNINNKVHVTQCDQAWMLDSGCTSHLCCNRKHFTRYKALAGSDTVTLPNGKGKRLVALE